MYSKSQIFAVHCSWYTVGEAVPKLNFGRLGGWLEGESRRSSLRKFARARHSVRKQVAPRFKNGPLLKRQKFKIESRVNLCQIELEIFLRAAWHPKAPVQQSAVKPPLLPQSPAG